MSKPTLSPRDQKIVDALFPIYLCGTTIALLRGKMKMPSGVVPVKPYLTAAENMDLVAARMEHVPTSILEDVTNILKTTRRVVAIFEEHHRKNGDVDFKESDPAVGKYVDLVRKLSNIHNDRLAPWYNKMAKRDVFSKGIHVEHEQMEPTLIRNVLAMPEDERQALSDRLFPAA